MKFIRMKKQVASIKDYMGNQFVEAREVIYYTDIKKDRDDIVNGIVIDIRPATEQKPLGHVKLQAISIQDNTITRLNNFLWIPMDIFLDTDFEIFKMKGFEV